jgi:hypothetical protein
MCVRQCQVIGACKGKPSSEPTEPTKTVEHTVLAPTLANTGLMTRAHSANPLPDLPQPALHPINTAHTHPPTHPPTHPSTHQPTHTHPPTHPPIRPHPPACTSNTLLGTATRPLHSRQKQVMEPLRATLPSST